MMKYFLSLIITFLFYINSQAQFTRYEVKLKNKGSSPFSFSNPSAFLSQRAIDRRTHQNITLDSTDLPVTPSYVVQIRNVPNVTVLNDSKWLNSVSIQTSDANAISTISNFPFVSSVSGIAARPNQRGNDVSTRNKFLEEEITYPVPPLQRPEGLNADYYNYGSNSFAEIHLHNGEFLHNIGLRGQGMQIAVLDGGFYNYTNLKAFDSMNANGQVLGTWDFVSREASVTEDHPHGMQCLSTIAANIPGQFIGKAPKANFYLFRTEDVNSEYPIEEHNWVCGAERADSAGADVISSSLGYYDFDNPVFNYTYTDMNGHTTSSVMGADLAAKKGLLVFNSAGNEGNNSWHYLITPSDGDSVVAVGAVNSAGITGSFSSYGPSSDGRIKPDLASVGVSALVEATNNTVGMSNGTSFSCPNMAGLGTCLWQGFPEFNNMKIVKSLHQASNKFNSPDDRTGFGIPDMKKAFASLLIDFSSANASVLNCVATINWTSKDVAAMKYDIERKAPAETNYTKVGELNPSPGTILKNNSYTFTNSVEGLNPGIVSYRIKQIIDTATASYTQVYIDTTFITLTESCVIPGANPVIPILTIQPNPVSGSMANLVIETSYNVSNMPILMYDNKGALVMKIASSKLSGKKTIEIPIDNLAKGKYYIRVFNSDKPIGTVELLRL